MRLPELIEHNYSTFQKQSSGARIILLHPDSRYRSLLIARLLNSPDINTFYYALGPDDIYVQSLLNGITHDIAAQHPLFGRHLNMLSPSEQNDHDILIETFAKDLDELSNEPYLLILDEYDHSDEADDIQLFLERLLIHLPEQCKIVINSRTLPRLPWMSMVARGHAIILEDDVLIQHDLYKIQEDGNYNLEVYALGPGFVLLDGKLIDAWEGHLPRLLLFLALDKLMVTRSEICTAFWPELDDDQAVNVFHVTKRRLHKALDMDVLIHDEGYYRINPEIGIYYDANEFVNSLMDARTPENTDRIASWQKAVDLYGGPFLQGHTDRWITHRREDYRAGYLEALVNIANQRLSENRPEVALNLYQRAIAEDFTRQDIHQVIMKLYTDMHRRSEAAAHYRNLVNTLPSISQETEALYNALME